MKHKYPDLHAERRLNSSAGSGSGVALKVFKLSFVPRSLLRLEIHLCFPVTPRGEVCCCSDISQLLCAASEPGAEIHAQPRLSRAQHMLRAGVLRGLLQTTTNSRHCFSTKNLSVEMLFLIYVSAAFYRGEKKTATLRL